MDAIRERIKNKSAGLKSYEEIMNRMQSMAGSSYLKPLAKFSNKSQQRLYEASNYYRLPNPYAVPAWKVRNDMKHIRELAGQCRYLQETKITSRQELEMRHDDLEKQIRYERSVKKSFSRVCRQLPEEEREKLNRYSYLAGQLGKKDLPEEVWENFSDEFENLEQELPTQELEAWQENQKKSSILKSLGKEKRMVEKLLKETEGPAVEKRKDMEVKRG
jgi:hypothetical protein